MFASPIFFFFCHYQFVWLRVFVYQKRAHGQIANFISYKRCKNLLFENKNVVLWHLVDTKYIVILYTERKKKRIFTLDNICMKDLLFV